MSEQVHSMSEQVHSRFEQAGSKTVLEQHSSFERELSMSYSRRRKNHSSKNRS